MAERSTRLLVALGGGVGSGKSTLGAQLAALGAHRIDADQIAREVVEPGTPGLAAVVERFGPQVLTADGRMDRAAVAAIVFGDDQARLDLNAILHPRIAELSNSRMNESPEAVVVYEIPLLAAGPRGQEFDLIVTVETPLELRLARLAERGLDEAAARARIAAQASDEELRSVSDVVVLNDGSTEDLVVQAERLWKSLLERQAAKASAAESF